VSDWDEFYGPNAGYVVELYDRYRRDPAAVDPVWRAYFDHSPPAAEVPLAAAAAQGCDPVQIIRVGQLVQAIREYGHLAADLDPLQVDRRPIDSLSPERHGLTQAALINLPPGIVEGPIGREAGSAAEVIERLRHLYCGSTGYEFAQVGDTEAQSWLYEAVESGRFAQPLSGDEERSLLERLTEVEAFELYLQRVFPGQTRFSIEGADVLIPMLDEIVAGAAEANICEVVIGSAHRGRLNVLANVIGLPYEEVMARFQGAVAPAPMPPAAMGPRSSVSTGDVRYHLGSSRPYPSLEAFRTLVKMPPNPSHLEFVSPVVEGMVRAAADDRRQPGQPGYFPEAALAILIHGDAAFSGQGIVAETLNLSRLPGYSTGGTLHILVDNQLAFTEEPESTRSTRYASDLAKGFGIPIVHVNADDVEACLSAVRLAFAYRQRFREDFLVDLIGYRRRGHNEADEPTFTQPLVYDLIATHPTVREIWSRRMIARGLISETEVEEMAKRAFARLESARSLLQLAPSPAFTGATAYSAIESGGIAATGANPGSDPGRGESGNGRAEPSTAVSLERMRQLNDSLLRLPAGFTLDPKLKRLWERRAAALGPEGIVDWGQAEALAFASILADGTPIRLTGEDTARGTFSQRHLVLHDRRTGETYTPLQALPEARAAFAVDDSPLSEASALGFEYGYSVGAPETLVIWEAQYGDFANGAQVIIDQFIVSGWSKWGQSSGLVMLLPHGYEGQGPEHSSARLERFLQLAANDNFRIANPSTAAQYFHLLRQQASRVVGQARPLIILTPKSLLRHPKASSPPAAFTGGTFQPIIDYEKPKAGRAGVSRLILCSGKVYYDLLAGGVPPPAVAVARVEQLYPFPHEQLVSLLGGYPSLEEVLWVQEEPENQGAWAFMAPRLQALSGGRWRLGYVGRPAMASPAEGSTEQHQREQSRIVREALAGAREGASSDS